MSKKQQSRKKDLPLSPARKRLFTGILIALPFILFALVEVSLRIFGVGHDVSLFETSLIGGRTYAMVNPNVAERYFSRLSFHPAVSTDAITIPKEPGTFRIFCLGASTTIGYPYGPAGSFSAHLRERLERTFPDRKFEIMNLGITATNSFTTLDLARDVMSYEPDALIVYDGHNEFYGALGVASQEAFTGSRWLTSLYLKAVRLRTFMVLRDLYNSLRSGTARAQGNETGTMMERVAKGQYVSIASPEYTAALSSFRENVESLIGLCSDRKVPLILSTQVSNLRDLHPFISGEFTGSTEDRKKEYNRLLDLGKKQLADAQPVEAANVLVKAWDIDSARAEVAYLIGRSLDRGGRRREALGWYVRARDLDQLRFRMSGEFNDMIRGEQKGKDVLVADIERVFSNASPDSIVGSNLVLEHVHPDMRGYFLMAKEYARLFRSAGMIAAEDEWARRDTVADELLWENRFTTVVDERAAARRVAYLTSGWPFKAGETRVPSIPAFDTLGRIAEEMITKVKTWEEAHIAAAEYYEKRGEFTLAAGEYRMLMKQEPYNSSAYLLLARTYIRLNRLPEARETLERSITVEPTVYACRTLGVVVMNENRFGDAAGYFEKGVAAAGSDKERFDLGFLLGLALYRNNETDRARTALENALKANQNNQQVMSLLERINAGGR